MEFQPVSMILRYEGGMRFTAENQKGLKIPIDAHAHLGGSGEIPNPIDYFIASFAGCVGIKILLVLSDHDIHPELFNIEILATRKQVLPAVFEKIHIIISLKGPIEEAFAINMISNVMTFLCPIAAMIMEVSEVTWEHSIK